MKESKRTAIRRIQISKPLRWIFEMGHELTWVFHQGPGRVDNPDRSAVRKAARFCTEYDPYWGPKDRLRCRRRNQNQAISIYVLNVLPPRCRRQALRDLRLTLKPNGEAFVAVRKSISASNCTPFEDGWITSTGTFQRAYSCAEITSELERYFWYSDVLRSDSAAILVRAYRPRKNELCESCPGPAKTG